VREKAANKTKATEATKCGSWW